MDLTSGNSINNKDGLEGWRVLTDISIRDSLATSQCPLDPPRASLTMRFESQLDSFVGIIANISGCHIPHSLDRPGYIAISWTHSVDLDSPLGSQKYIGAGSVTVN